MTLPTEHADQAATAARVACPERRCGASVGNPCRNLATGKPLTRRPAHERRLAAAGIESLPTDPRDLRRRD